MLTWAIMWYFSNQINSSPNGLHVFFAMIFDTIMVVSITACWWAKYTE